jgi:hypothetical protein
MLRGLGLVPAFASSNIVSAFRGAPGAAAMIGKMGNMDALYDSLGHPSAYVDADGTSIYLYDGSAVGWIDQVDVYAYSGRYLGWVQDGWFFDRAGQRAFFTDATKGGPTKPARGTRPPRADRAARRARGTREAKPTRPACGLAWAPLSGTAYFNQ